MSDKFHAVQPIQRENGLAIRPTLEHRTGKLCAELYVIVDLRIRNEDRALGVLKRLRACFQVDDREPPMNHANPVGAV